MATNRIFTAAKEYLSNFQLKIPRTAPKLSKASIKWRPPLGELYKTNYDGTVFSESGEAGIGVVVQDAKGEVIAALAEKITYPGSVVLLEALATRRAAKFIVELGISLFEFEGDLEVVYRALRTTATRPLARLSKTLCLFWVRLGPFLSLILGSREIVLPLLWLREQLFLFLY